MNCGVVMNMVYWESNVVRPWFKWCMDMTGFVLFVWELLWLILYCCPKRWLIFAKYKPLTLCLWVLIGDNINKSTHLWHIYKQEAHTDTYSLLCIIYISLLCIIYIYCLYIQHKLIKTKYTKCYLKSTYLLALIKLLIWIHTSIRLQCMKQPDKLMSVSKDII